MLKLTRETAAVLEAAQADVRRRLDGIRRGDRRVAAHGRSFPDAAAPDLAI